MIGIVRAIAFLMISATASCLCQAQLSGWRYEDLNLPPVVNELRVISGVYHASSHGGAFVLDTSTSVWSQASLELGSLRLWGMQATGVAITQRGNDVYRYHAEDRATSRRDNVYYQFEHDDATVCTFSSKYDPALAAFLSLATWYRWPTRDTIRVDTAVSRNVYPDVIACADTSALVFSDQQVIRYRFRGQPEVIDLPDTVQLHRRSVYIDRSSTHILVLGRNTLLYSVDHGQTWLTLFSSEREAVHSFCATDDPDQIYVVLDSVLTRYHVSSGQRDTLHSSSRWGLVMLVEHGPKGAIVAYPDTVMLIDDLTNEKALVHTGLPQRSVVDLIAVPDGVAGAGAREIVYHPAHGAWSTPAIDPFWLRLDPTDSPSIFRGGRSLDDLWLTRGSWAMHFKPRDHLETFEFTLMPQAGSWAHPTGNRFTVINNIEGYPGDRQVAWWSGSSPDRLLLAKDGLRFLVAFEDSVFVAFGTDGSGWRTVDQTHERWEEISIPPINLGVQPRSQVKGRHGVVRGPRMKAWTNDAGRTWQVDSLPKSELIALASNGVIFHVWEDDQPGTEFSLVIERQVGTERVVITNLPESYYDRQRNTLMSAVYDDNEQRLYIATDHWVGSLSLSTVSVNDPVVRPMWSSATHQHGWYDLFGRFMGPEEPTQAATGLYLYVSEQGIEKRLLPPQRSPK